MKILSREKMYWFFTAVAGLSVTALLFFSPAVYGQDMSSFQEERLLRTFRQVFDFVQDNYVEEVDPDVLIEGAMKGMFESLDDPYSAYLDTEDMRSLTDTTSGEFGGVGLYINKVRPDEDRPQLQEWVEVVSPIEGTPAYRAGMRPRDLIIEIEGESTIEMSIDEVVDRLRGEPGSVVEITILRNMKNELNIELERAIIEIPTVRHAAIDDDIAYLRIIQFTPRTAEKVEEALRELKESGHREFILDLRTNPGGLLTSAVDTADLFFDDGLVVGTAGRVAGENQAFYARQGTVLDDTSKLIVVINEGTASAAEILAGALRDRDRAVVVGTTSYGKGSVQQVRSLGDGGFRLTMARYYTPDETFIDKVGIEPDITVEEPELTEKESEDLITIQQEDRIQEFLNQAGNNPGENRIRQFFNGLRNEGFEVNERLVRRLITLELEMRTNESAPYDLDYDLVLQEAVRILRENETRRIINSREESNSMSSRGNALPEPALQ
ncbi:S41 family peptidase [Salinispira pacifica]|uniref:Carboxyl-terminal protease n=1 Tax=Salinispira pacifica TaxID=1307761 RepID=V5WCJ9_9SPIO|nr:S41 family peptidase [Salinispira pacifica]AHC13502.1 Carboxyl-terminal protease [Salinispira pacifica]